MQPSLWAAVELRNALERQTGLELPSTLVFDYPTVSALTGFLAGRLALHAPAGEEIQLADEASRGSSAGSVTWEAGLGGELHLAPGAAAGLRLVGVSELVVRSAGGALLSIQPSDQSMVSVAAACCRLWQPTCVTAAEAWALRGSIRTSIPLAAHPCGPLGRRGAS